jgi:hypothetical protein
MNAVEVIRVENGYIVRSMSPGYYPNELTKTAYVFHTLDQVKEHLFRTFEEGK